MKKTAVVFAAAILLGSTAARAESVRIGVIAEITGDMPAVGASCRNAAKMAADEANAAGGLAVGKKQLKVELVVEDNGGKADQSAAAAQKLITQDEVVAIVGPNASRYAIPASEIAEGNQTIFITPWSTNPKTTLDAVTGNGAFYPNTGQVQGNAAGLRRRRRLTEAGVRATIQHNGYH